jgi:hypothetical protein
MRFPPALGPLSRAALVVAHPGHELRVHGWLELTRPTVFVLTDGSGRACTSRLPWTRRILARAGAVPAPPFGPLSDLELYAALLRGDRGLFLALAEELAAALEAADVDYVAADAAEGHNPAHDLCRAVTDAATALLRRRGRHLLSFDFALDGPPRGALNWPQGGSIELTLDETTLARKWATAAAYPPLAGEVVRALDRFGARAFRHEHLRLVSPAGASLPAFPFYESHGARRVAAGHYRQVVRYCDHVLPLVEALRRHVEREPACAR